MTEKSYSYHYQAFGWHIASVLEIPELLEIEKNIPDITIDLGEIPEKMEGAKDKGVVFQAKPGHYILNVKGVARFMAIKGQEVTIQPEPGVDEKDIRVFLLGSVFGAISHQRKVLPVHASAVEIDGKAYLFAGQAGTGKSTIAAILEQKGYRVLTDDLAILTLNEKGDPFITPGTIRLKLWEDTLQTLQMPYDPKNKVRNSLKKYTIPISEKPEHLQVPVAHIFYFTLHHGKDYYTAPVRGKTSFGLLLKNTYRSRLMEGLGVKENHFKLCRQFVKKTPASQLFKPIEKPQPNELLECILQKIRL